MNFFVILRALAHYAPSTPFTILLFLKSATEKLSQRISFIAIVTRFHGKDIMNQTKTVKSKDTSV